MVAISTFNQLTLPDDRRLGYATYGREEHWPILFFHGTPGSRHASHLAGLVASALDARVVALERPGYGLSDPLPGRRITDWPADVEAAVELLGINRFSLIGYSGGGPFALATAAALGDRVASLAVVSGMGPLYSDHAEVQLGWRERLRRLAIARATPVVRLVAWRIGRQVRRDAEAFVRRRAAESPEADRLHMERPEIRAVMQQDLMEAYRQGGDATAREFQLFARPWEIDLGAIDQPMQLWHGTDDHVVPIWLADAVAQAIPHAQQRYLSGLGHLLLLDHMDGIISHLLGTRSEFAASA